MAWACGVVVAGADDADDLVDIVLGDEQALQQVGALLCLAEVKLRAPDDDLFLERQILVQDMAKGEDLRLGLVVDQGQHVDGKARLHGSLGEKAVEDHLGIGVALEFNDHAHAVAVGLVAQIGDAVDALVVHLVGDVLDELALVDLVGKLGDNDAGAALTEFLKLRAGPDDDLAAPRQIRLTDTAAAHDDALRREVRAGDVLHEVGEGALGIVQHLDAGVDDFAQVVGRDVGRHADGDAGRAVDQQIRELRGQNARFLPRLVEVGIPVHGLLLDIAQHLVCDPGKPRLGVTVGGRGIAVDGAEVAVAVDEHFAHGKALGQADHRVVNGGVAVGVVTAQHVADAGGGLLKGLVGGQTVLIERIENAPVHGL